ncbi:MAG: molybdate ABC transporter substrate-binding protein, partial [Acinetobacter sp.]|nr:molybdate ABC transporter substrate-binding protein [Acinetobacter sp.]
MKKFLFSLSLLAMGHAYAEDTITVYAAASLTNVLAELDQKYEKKNNIKIKTSYAGSSTLAKQIEAGAPANLFISADEQWMNYLQDKKLIDPKNRKNLLGNRLVLISPKNQNIQFKMTPSFDPTTAFKGKL